MSWWGSGMRSCWVDIALLLAPKQVPAAVPNLICYCSVATVACIWHIDFLSSTLFGVSCRCSSVGGKCHATEIRASKFILLGYLWIGRCILSDKDRNFIYPHIPCDDIVHTDSNVWLYLYVPGDSSKLVCCWLLDYLAYLRSNFNTAKGDAWGWCMNLRPSSGRPQFLRTDGWVEDRDFVPNIGEMWILTRHGNTMGQWSAHQNKTSRRCTLGNSRKEGFVDFSLIHRDGPTIETQCPLHFVTPR